MTTWKDFVKNGAFFFTPESVEETKTGIRITHKHEGKTIEGDIQCRDEDKPRLKGNKCRVQIIAGESDPSIVVL